MVVLGVAAAGVADPAFGAEVVNGGFEAPAVQGTVVRSAPESFGGWALTEGSIRHADSTEWAPAAGAQSIAFSDSSSFSQQIATVPGGRYRLSFRHADGAVPPPGGYISCGSIQGIGIPLYVWWADRLVATLHQGDPAHLTDDWQQFSTLVAATGTSTPLRFSSQPFGIQSCAKHLDEVTLSPPAASDTATLLDSSANTSVSGQPVTLTATVIGATAQTPLVGAVQFAIDGTAAAAPVPLDASGQAKLTTTTLAVGVHTISAAFQPAAASGLDASRTELTQTVAKADTEIMQTIVPDPTVAGQPAEFTATVSPVAPGAGTPTGTVQFFDDDGSAIDEPQPLDATGRATINASALAGSYLVHAAYSGDARFNPDEVVTEQTVNRAATITTLNSFPNPVAAGADVTFEATIEVQPPGDVDPFGTISILVDGFALGDPFPVMGYTAFALVVRAPQTPQTNNIALLYSGDDNTSPSSASLTQIVIATAPAPSAPTRSVPPPGGATAPAMTTQTLQAMVDGLARALKRRGLRALTRTAQSITVPSAGTLTQQVYGQRRARSTTARRARIKLAAAKRVFDSAATASIRLRATAAGRKRLRSARKLKLTIVTRWDTTTAAPIQVTKRLTVKRTPRRARSITGNDWTLQARLAHPQRHRALEPWGQPLRIAHFR